MPATAYSPVAKFLHWLVVALIALQFALGWLMPGARRTTPPDLINAWHVSFGMIILAAIVIRTVWRLFAGPPAPEPSMPRWQIAAAHWTHMALYGLIFALVFSGWASAAAHNWPIAVFSYPLPELFPGAAFWTHAFGELHAALIWVLLGLIGLHTAAALGHHFILGDDVLRRMLPNRMADWTNCHIVPIAKPKSSSSEKRQSPLMRRIPIPQKIRTKE